MCIGSSSTGFPRERAHIRRVQAASGLAQAFKSRVQSFPEV
jgi:hypothetical protein